MGCCCCWCLGTALVVNTPLDLFCRRALDPMDHLGLPTPVASTAPACGIVPLVAFLAVVVVQGRAPAAASRHSDEGVLALAD